MYQSQNEPFYSTLLLHASTTRLLFIRFFRNYTPLPAQYSLVARATTHLAPTSCMAAARSDPSLHRTLPHRRALSTRNSCGSVRTCNRVPPVSSYEPGR